MAQRYLHILTRLAALALVLPLVPTGCGGDADGDGDGDGRDTDISITGDGDQDGKGGQLNVTDYEDSDGGVTDLTDKQLQSILDAECTGAEAEGERLPSTLELIIDVSGSMNKSAETGEPPEGGEPNKWDTTKAALLSAVDHLPSSVSLGAVYYPNKRATVHAPGAPGPVSSCINVDGSLPIASLGTKDSAQRAAFVENIDAVWVDNYTPTHDAYNYGLTEHLLHAPGGNRFMLLITDGAPTINGGCQWPEDDGKAFPIEVGTGDGSFDGETAPIIADIDRALADEGVRTFIIGAPGSEESVESNTDMRPWLSAAARAGGTSPADCSDNGPNYCHFDMAGSGAHFARDLTSVLATIAGQVANACTFKIPDPPQGETLDPNKTQVIIEWGDGTNQLIRPDAIDECQDQGWRYNEADQTVETCGATCDRIKLDYQAVVHVSFGCTEQDIIVR